MIKNKTIKTGFYPIVDPVGKQNYKNFFRIERDGSVTENVFLSVFDPRHREELICKHYLKFLTQHFLDEDIRVRFLTRDDPWDFKVELSNSMKFNLEITSIADSEEQFTVNTREEQLLYWKHQKTIPLYELKKLETFFPDDGLTNAVKKFKDMGIEANQSVSNPLASPNPCITISTMPNPSESLEGLIKTALDKKCSKRHSEKESTVLIIDNKTSFFDICDYQEAACNLREHLPKAPFKEIWFYTGYFSDNDGNNSEFSFAPLKIPEKYSNRMEALADMHGVDNNGRVIV